MGVYQSTVVLQLLILVFLAVLFTQYLLTNVAFLLPWVQPLCSHECLETYMSGPPSITEPALLNVMRNSYLTPPPAEPDTTSLDIHKPVWSRLVDWSDMQENLMEIWKDQAPGVFVEVGAVDGEFMSQTLMLEKNLSWTGLLIEPDPRSFRLLQKSRRNAWTSPVCIQYSKPSTMKYWLRDLDEDLPEHFLQLLMARSKLNDETLAGDEERGRSVIVPCVPLTTVLLAANLTSIDFLTIATGVNRDDERIRDVLHSTRFDVKTMLIHYPTGRMFEDPYPYIRGYVLDMQHSTLLVKLYIKRSHCKFISNDKCKSIHHYDSEKACLQYYCLDFLTVWSIPPRLH